MSANKSKGTKWETDLVKFFTERGIPARRVAQEGFKDSGDLHGLSPFVGQAKNWKSWEDAIREGLDGAERQKINAGEPYGVAFVKRVRKGTGEGYAVMTVATFADLLRRLYRAESGA
ncbi:RusA-like Holliday junction resolvase [Arthrobacter phage Elezi]|uniref:Holliday junction resolvase n=1 Tax=Arthrobacter phage Elezi TaxID=2762410 RepID=A0A7G8LH13_9CAUD|nr:RusA-like Holliday junction resolvase [Arthrobacter phage Elezi]QNJ56535.1 holliday junction resolvase [Arthrobacter phage Elezi]QOP64338.1 holliday junction resolvase [Arthrobacter phage London]